ncbi:hypothetical protein CCR95_05275 [Thiocystis minor]|uniref:Clp protease N-terminal domain-containing protein n=1 Tax=Thiocystis minor TaxID=61597 RepID=UPI001911A629|nr:Clp protease N-terminal domain-containing protein [Thiocystis minor]MBK5963514.1 hypothetical protein [Thiocystis minor]
MIQNINQLSTLRVMQTFETAVNELVALRQNLLTTDVLLMTLISQEDAEPMRILEQLLSNPAQAVARIRGRVQEHYRAAVSTTGNQILISQEIEQAVRIARAEAKRFGDSLITTGTLFLALFDAHCGPTATLLSEAGIGLDEARKALETLRGGRTVTTAEAESEPDVLARFTRDLTELARRRELDPVIGRENEIAQVIQTLSRRKKNNPALIGEAGVGKTVIVEGLAQRIADAEVPDTLLNKRLLALEAAAQLAERYLTERQLPDKAIDLLDQRLAVRRIEVVVEPTVIDKLARDGFDPIYGARPLRREVERQLENPLAMLIVTGQCPDGSRGQVGLDEQGIMLRVDTDATGGEASHENTH